MKTRKLQVGHLAVCRTPAFSPEDQLCEVWAELKEAIRDSAHEFYGIIAGVSCEDIPQPSPKAQFTVWKYFNRARFRATPHGSFAAITAVPVNFGKVNKTEQVIVARKLQQHHWIDWSQHAEMEQGTIGDTQKIRSNSSAYRCGKEIRFMSRIKDGFELSSVAYSKELWEFLDACSQVITVPAAINALCLNMELAAEEASAFLNQLVELQLLFTDRTPNITGADYFTRMGLGNTGDKKPYTIATRAREEGTLNAQRLDVLTEYVEFISRCKKPSVSENLASFASAFAAKFEEQEVPLLAALDPELGVGYGQLETDRSVPEIIQALTAAGTGSTTRSSYTSEDLRSFLLNHAMQAQSGSCIPLDQFSSDKNTGDQPLLPNSLNVILRFSDELIILDGVGNATATTLLGRFTLADESIAAFCKQLTERETQANPGVIFFDIPYFSEQEVDNINRREQVYAYELPLLSWSCSEKQLGLHDILVSVRGQEVVLRSASLGKRLIPRLASAYNASRSDLAVFRFLSDLQHQGLHTNLTLSLQEELPGLDYYPRLQYQQIVVSPAKWKVPAAFCKVNNKPATATLTALAGWLAARNISFPVRTGFMDQALYFDPGNERDLTALLTYCSQNSEVYIAEALLPKDSRVTDQQGRSYLAEWIVSLEHDEKIYNPFSGNVFTQPKEDIVNGIVPPGNEWLYFQLYCHPLRANELLTGIIGKWLGESEGITKWFFIRYADPGTHIRLRLLLKQQERGYALVRELSLLLRDYLQHGIVPDVAIKTYHREMHRYGHAGIENVEQCFYEDSRFVLFLLQQGFDSEELYRVAIVFCRRLMESVYETLEQQILFVDSLVNGLAKQVGLHAEDIRKLKDSYKGFRERTAMFAILPEVDNSLQQTLAQMHETIGKVDKQTAPKLLADLFHMHVNRLFGDNQQAHELVIYSYTVRLLQEERGKKNALKKNTECKSDFKNMPGSA